MKEGLWLLSLETLIPKWVANNWKVENCMPVYGSQPYDVTRGMVRRVNILQMRISCRTCHLFWLRNACISSLVPCRNIGLLLDETTMEVIVNDGFRVASATKWSSKQNQNCTHSSGKCLPEIQRWLECPFLDGCPHKRWFPVAIATKRSSRTLLDSWPLEVCA